MSRFSVQVCVILECAAEEAMGVSDLDRQIDQLKRRARLFLQLPELSVPQAPSYLTEWQGHGRVDAHIHAGQISICLFMPGANTSKKQKSKQLGTTCWSLKLVTWKNKYKHAALTGHLVFKVCVIVKRSSCSAGSPFVNPIWNERLSQALCSKARDILVEECNVQRVDAPVTAGL